MAATTSSIQGKYRPSHGPFVRLQMAADNIPLGAMVMINADGYVSNAADTASTFFFGIAVEGFDNSGGSPGDAKILVDIGGAEVRTTHATGSLSIADVGALVHQEFNNEVEAVAGSAQNIVCGVIIEVVGVADIWVKLTPYKG